VSSRLASLVLALQDASADRISECVESEGRMRLMTLVPKQTIAFVCLVSLGACTFYAAPSLEAWVVDASSARPIEGVIVVAHWQALGGLEGLNPVGQVMIMENVSDRDGRISFPKWSKFSRQTVKWDRPELLLFKNGYEPRRLINEQYAASIWPHQVLKSEWSGKHIAMVPFKGSLPGYYENVWNLDFSMQFARRGESCEWKETPRMITALHQMSIYFELSGAQPRGERIGRLSDLDETQRRHCGAPEEFLATYLEHDYTK
jgi:hypothetical protein